MMKETKTTPEVTFSTDGELKIQGKFYPDNAERAFQPLVNWVDQLQTEHVVLDINLDYLNTSSNMQLFGLIKRLDDKYNVDELTVNWHYEEDDEDHLETGLIYQDSFSKAKFNFYKFVDEF